MAVFFPLISRPGRIIGAHPSLFVPGRLQPVTICRPNKLRVLFKNNGSTSLEFLGAWSSASCGPLSPYITDSSELSLSNSCASGYYIGWQVDLWKAWQDGAWTSSVVLKIYSAASLAITTSVLLAYHGNGALPPGHVCFNFTAGPPYALCGPLVRTVTFYEDFTVTHA